MQAEIRDQTTKYKLRPLTIRRPQSDLAIVAAGGQPVARRVPVDCRHVLNGETRLWLEIKLQSS